MTANKAWVGSLGAGLTGLLVWMGLPDEVAVPVGMLLTGILVYFVPNLPRD